MNHHTKKSIDDMIKNIHKEYDKTIVINYVKYPNRLSYEINPAVICNLNESYCDGEKICDSINENIKSSEKNKVYFDNIALKQCYI